MIVRNAVRNADVIVIVVNAVTAWTVIKTALATLAENATIMTSVVRFCSILEVDATSAV